MGLFVDGGNCEVVSEIHTIRLGIRTSSVARYHLVSMYCYLHTETVVADSRDQYVYCMCPPMP